MKQLFLLLALVLVLTGIKAQTQTVNITTATSAAGTIDPIWSVVYPTGTTYPCGSTGTSSGYCAGVTRPTAGAVPAGIYKYKMTFTTTTNCPAISAQLNCNRITADNRTSSFEINGHTYTFPAAGIFSATVSFTTTINPAHLLVGTNTVIFNVVNDVANDGVGPTPTYLYLCGNININYNSTPIVPSFVPNQNTMCANDPLTFNGSASTGPIQNHYWEMAECDAYANVTGNYTYFTWVAGMPGVFTFPTAPCNKYYKIKLAVQNSCNVWVETSWKIYYECNPSFSITSTSAGDCIGGTFALSTDLTNPTSYYYDWQLPVGAGLNSDPTLTVTTSTVSQVINLTVTSPNGCSSTNSYTVNPGGASYCCQTPNQILDGGNVTQLPGSSYTGGLLQINGTLLINTNFTFSGTMLRMAPNAKIIVGPGVSLTLTNCHLFACSYMWEGIELSNGSILNTSTSTIDDANIAVLANASTTTAPIINMTSTVMCKNYYGIEVANYTSSATYPITLSSVDMRGNFASTYSPGTNFKPYKRTWIPDIITPTSTEYGILLQNVNLVSIGSATSGTNYFRNMKCGIRSMNSNTSVNKCYFTNLSTSSSSYGVGIWASGTNGGSISGGNGYEYKLNAGIIPGPNTNTANTFMKVGTGIITGDCVSNQIENNKFYDINYAAIDISSSNYLRTVSPGNYTRNYAIIRNNLIRKLTVGMLNGILLHDNTSLNATVQTNTISVIPSTSSTGEGIVTQDIATTSSPYGTNYIVDGNTISDQAQNAIRVENVKNSQYTNNIINLKKTYSKGIFLITSSGNTVKSNIIDASYFADYWNAITAICLNASSTVSCPNNKIWCNKAIRTQAGFSSFLDCSGTNLDGNTFDGCYIGINLFYSIIGQQGSPYTGSYTGAIANDFKNSAISIMADHSNGAASPYYTVPVGGFQCIPTVVTNISGTNVPVYTTTASPQGQLGCIILTINVVKEFGTAEGEIMTTARLTNEVQIGTSLSVYPNPANEILFLKGDNLDGAEISITDILGNNIKKSTSFSTEGIDVRDLQNGSYLLVVKSLDGTIDKIKVVIIK